MSALHGGRVNYYLVEVPHPQREDQAPYRAECEDIADALQLTPNEFCEFKAIWRTAAARLGNGKPDQKALYDAQKRVHYATRDMLKLQREAEQAHTPVPLRDDETIRKTVYGDEPVVFGSNIHAEEPVMVDGWIVAVGGQMPDTLSNEQLVEVRLKDGTEYTGNFAKRASDWIWLVDGTHTTITHYRLMKVEQQEPPQAEWREVEDAFMPAGLEPDEIVEIKMSNGLEMMARRADKWDWAYRARSPLDAPQITHWRRYRHLAK